MLVLSRIDSPLLKSSVSVRVKLFTSDRIGSSLDEKQAEGNGTRDSAVKRPEAKMNCDPADRISQINLRPRVSLLFPYSLKETDYNSVFLSRSTLHEIVGALFVIGSLRDALYEGMRIMVV